MKRDFDLLRNMLFRIEAQPSDAKITNSTFSDLCDDKAVIALHIALLHENQMIIAVEIPRTRQNYPDFWILRMTSAGYDYLDSVRNDSIWQKTQNTISKMCDTLPIEVTKSIANHFIMEMLPF